HRDADEQREVAPAFRPRGENGVDRGLDLQRVLAGLDQDAVDSAVGETARLLEVARLEDVVGSLPERDELRARPDRAEDEARLVLGREALARAARDLRGDAVDLARAIAEAELGEHERVRAERVRLDDVAADLEVALVDRLDHVGTREVHDLDAVLLPEVVAL